MARIPLLPRTALHFLNAFIIVAIFFIVFFPNIGFTKSIDRPAEDDPTIITEAFANTVSPSITVKLQQPNDHIVYEDDIHDGPSQAIDPSSRTSVSDVLWLTLQVTWNVIVLLGTLFFMILRPLHIAMAFLSNKFFFLIQPFVIMATGFYTFTIVWPIQLVNYLAKLFYPLYIFLACAAILGTIAGVTGSYTSTLLNDTFFPAPPPKSRVATPKHKRPSLFLRPKSSESQPESQISSGVVTPTPPPIRAPPPSKVPSSGMGLDDIHVLDTNALFSSFSLPIPPPTPPGMLHSSSTSAGSVAGVNVAETIFEEDDSDDSDEKTPIASGSQSSKQESRGFDSKRPLTRPESEHERLVGEQLETGTGSGRTETWHSKVKRETVDAQGVDWGNEEVRRRKTGIAG